MKTDLNKQFGELFKDFAKLTREIFEVLPFGDLTKESLPKRPVPARLRWSSEDFCNALKFAGRESRSWPKAPDVTAFAAFKKYFQQLREYTLDGNEHGSIVTLNLIDNKLFKTKTSRGSSGGVTVSWLPTEGTHAVGNVPVLMMHSHPPGSTGLHFSPQDIGSMLSGDYHLQASVVVIGSQLLMMTRTPQTPGGLTVQGVMDRIDQECRRVPQLFQYAPHSKILQLTLWACAHYNLELYIADMDKESAFKRVVIRKR